MNRVNNILNHPLFIENLEKNRTAEADRRFCRHDMAHFLDVARIARIMNLEEGLGLPEALIYGAALLHDIGKHRQYEEGAPHEQASALIAPEILRDCGFDEKETAVIADAILQHRNSGVIPERNLRGLLYRADKASRPCFACKAEKECSWKDGRKNKEIVY
ncbi:MAG: HD domain-containing protein [Butyrivibrio sp.]|nr:HD domain-containing protein [Acetatifactor muris]MCM1559989.1 HD domain-containing protein [Butyrivibrio sp.]